MLQIRTTVFELRRKFIAYKLILLILINFVQNACPQHPPSLPPGAGDNPATQVDLLKQLNNLPSEQNVIVRKLYQELLNLKAFVIKQNATIEDHEDRSVHIDFSCAMSRLSSHMDTCFNFFELNRIKLPKTTTYDNFPTSVWKLLHESDIGFNHPHRPYGRFSHKKPAATKQSFAKWCMVLNLDDQIALKDLARELQGKVENYFKKNQENHLNEPDYFNITMFYYYYAATITRFYKLGNLYKHNLIDVLTPHPLMVSQLPRFATKKPEASFSETLLYHMPYWYLTDEDISLLNILWGVVGYEPMDIGLRIQNCRNESVVIPKMKGCLREYRNRKRNGL